MRMSPTASGVAPSPMVRTLNSLVRILQVAGRLLDLLGLQRGLHVEDGQLQRLELVVVDPDAQVARLVAGERDLADAGQDLELVDDVELEDIR